MTTGPVYGVSSSTNTTPQAQLQLEERRAGKILLDLIDTRAAEVVILKAQIHAREIARQEVASLIGLLMRRLRGEPIPGLMAALGEALRDYTQTTDEPGE